MKEKQKFSNCRFVSSTIMTIDNTIAGLVDVKLNFAKGTAKVKTKTVTITFDNLFEAHVYCGNLVIEFDDGSNIILKPVQLDSENENIKRADELIERERRAAERSEDPTKDEAVDREERPQERTKDETFETKERTETRAFMGLKLDPTMKKILDGYSDKSDKIMEKLDDYLEIYDNASNASVMLAARQARFYETLSMILGDFAKISPEFFKLLSKEIDEEFKRRDNDALQKELKDQTKALEKEISKLEEEKEDIKGRIKALRKREQEILHEEGITTAEDIKKEDDK